MVFISILCLAPNEVVEQDLQLLLLWFWRSPLLSRFRLTNTSSFVFVIFSSSLFYLVYTYVTCMHTWGISICKVSDCSSSRRSATEATAPPPRPLRISTVPLL